jgi:hypothetical protein
MAGFLIGMGVIGVAACCIECGWMPVLHRLEERASRKDISPLPAERSSSQQRTQV